MTYVASVTFNDFRPELLVEQVSRILTDAVLSGALRSGEQLVETKLQKQFGISRSPLREAFRDLEKKGLVEIIPRKGTFVKRLTEKDIVELLPVRAALEGLAARLTHAAGGGRTARLMSSALSGMRRAERNNDPRSFFEFHLSFHDILIQGCENQTLMDHLQRIRLQSIWHSCLFKYSLEDFEAAAQTHEELLEVFKSAEISSDEVGLLVQEHVIDDYRRFMNKPDLNSPN